MPTSSEDEDYQQVCDRYLASLRLGRQAPAYKRAKRHIEAFIKQLEDKAQVQSITTDLSLNPEALQLLSQEFKDNSVRFSEEISIEPGYFLTFDEVLQAVRREMAIPYGELASHEKDFLRGWDDIYHRACVEVYRRNNGTTANLNRFAPQQIKV